MLEPTETDAARRAPAPRRLLIGAWLGGAVAAGAGLAVLVTWIGNPAGTPEPSEPGLALATTGSSAPPSAVASVTAAATMSSRESASAVPTPAAIGAGDFADLRLELEDTDTSAAVGRIWDGRLAESVARQLGVDVSSLGVRTVATTTSDALPPAWTAIAVSYPGGDPVGAVGGYLAEQLRRPGMRVSSGPINESERLFVFGEDWALGWSDELLVLMAFDVDPYMEASPDDRNALPNPHLLIATVAERLLGASPEATAGPSWRPFPSIAPEPTAVADPALEALLPMSVLGHPQEITSFAWLTAEQVSSFMGGLHPLLLTHFERDPDDASLALGSGSVSNFAMWAHRLRGVSGDELLGAYLGDHFARLMSAQGRTWEGREVEGRRYIFNEGQGLYAQGDVLYWILYFDLGDCFDDCDYDTRPPFDEILRGAIAAIPEP